MKSIEAFIRVARKQVGKPYVWGTAGPDTFDCSGLIFYCVNQMQDPDLAPELRSSQRQWEKLGRPLHGEALQSGDLMFWGNGQAEHVGIFLKNEGILHAFNEEQDVTISLFEGRAATALNMGTPYMGARRLFDGDGRPKVTGGQRWTNIPATSAPPSEAVTGSAPLMPSASTTGREITMTTSQLTVTTPFRSIGDVSLATWREVMASGKIGDVDACYQACAGYSALALAQAVKESSLGAAPGSAEKKNPLGLMLPDGTTLMSFAYWPLAFAEFRRRLTDPGYKNLVYYKGDKGIVPGYDMSILAYLITYVGGPDCLTTRGARCANGETYDETKPKDGDPQQLLDGPSINLYTAQTLKRLREWLGLPDPTPGNPPPVQTGDFQRITFAGGVVGYLPKTVLFRTVLTPVGRNRPGRRMIATSTTQHETGNTRVGAGAKMHSTWQDSGTPGHPDGYVAVHFYVDDDQIIQKIPVNEDGIHAGDWRNTSSLSVERCVNADQTTFADSETNSAWLQAALLKYVVRKSAKEAMYPHRSPTGTGNCPVHIGYHWSAFEDRVDRLIAQLP